MAVALVHAPSCSCFGCLVSATRVCCHVALLPSLRLCAAASRHQGLSCRHGSRRAIQEELLQARPMGSLPRCWRGHHRASSHEPQVSLPPPRGRRRHTRRYCSALDASSACSRPVEAIRPTCRALWSRTMLQRSILLSSRQVYQCRATQAIPVQGPLLDKDVAARLRTLARWVQRPTDDEVEVLPSGPLSGAGAQAAVDSDKLQRMLWKLLPRMAALNTAVVNGLRQRGCS